MATDQMSRRRCDQATELAYSLADVAVIIPALNEAESLPHVLTDLPRVGRVIVVDNGSTDGTAAVARSHGATVVEEALRGYGAACWRGMEFLRQEVERRKLSVQIVAFLDADYSDHPVLLPRLVQPILADDADFVLASRLRSPPEPGAMPPQSVYGNRLACFLMRWLLGVTYTDLGPFRAIRYDKLYALGMTDRGFGWTVEMQIKAFKEGLRVREVSLPYRARLGNSKISGTWSGTVKAGTKILYTIAKYATPKQELF